MSRAVSEQKRNTSPVADSVSFVEDSRSLDPKIKLNKALTAEELVRVAFKLSPNQSVSPWHLASLAQLGNPALSDLKLGEKIPAGTQIGLGPLAYDIRHDRAEKLLIYFEKELLFKRGVNALNTLNAIEYLKEVISEPKPELLNKTSKLESEVSAIFRQKSGDNQVSDWLTECWQNSGRVTKPAPLTSKDSTSLIQLLDGYIYSLPSALRKRGIEHALNLANRISSAFGAELTEWSIKRSQEWGIAPSYELKNRYATQLKDKVLSQYDLARYEAEQKQGPGSHLEELDRGYELLGAKPSVVATTQFYLAKAEIFSREGDYHKEIEFRVKALKEVAGDNRINNLIPGFSPDLNEVSKMNLESYAKGDSFNRVIIYNRIKALPEDRKALVAETLSSLVATLQRLSQDPSNNDKEKTLKQASLVLDLLAQTTEHTPTGKVEFLLSKGKQENLNSNPLLALKSYEEARNVSLGLVRSGNKAGSSYLAAVAREECALALEHRDKVNAFERVKIISSQVQEAIPQNKALTAELTLFTVQALAEANQFEKAQELLRENRDKFKSIGRLDIQVKALLEEKSSSKFGAGLKTALGIAADASSIEWAMGCAAVGLILGSIVMPGAGSATGAKVGFAIGSVLAVAALGRVIANRDKVYQSYETGMTNVSNKDALLAAAGLALDMAGAGKAVGVTARLGKLLVANDGAKLLVKSLFSRETEELTRKFLRGVLKEEVFQKAAAKGPEYLKLKAEEYFQRLFNKASKGALDTALDSSLGGILLANQGREIVGQLYEIQNNKTLTPAQREEALKQVGLQITQLVAFLGAIQGMSSSLDGIADSRIRSLQLKGSEFKSLEQVNDPPGQKIKYVSELEQPKLDLLSPQYDFREMSQTLKLYIDGFWSALPTPDPAALGALGGNVFRSRDDGPRVNFSEGYHQVTQSLEELLTLLKKDKSKNELATALARDISTGKTTLGSWVETATLLIDRNPESDIAAAKAATARNVIGQIALETRVKLIEEGYHDLGGGQFSTLLSTPKLTTSQQEGVLNDSVPTREQRAKSYELYEKLQRADRGEIQLSVSERRKAIRLLNAYNRLDEYLFKLKKHLDGSQQLEGKQLRQHQYDALESMQRFLERGDRSGYIKLPTGTGKTALFVEFAEILGLKTLVCVPRNILGEQSANSVHDWAPGVDVGIVDGSFKENGRQITITTYQSLRSQLEQGEERKPGSQEGLKPDDFDIVLFDEAHRSLGEITQNQLRAFNEITRIGFTATPDFSDRKRVEYFLGGCLYNMESGEAIQKGILTGVQIIHQKTEVDLQSLKVKSEGDDVTGFASEEELAKAVNVPARNAYALSNYKRFLMPDGNPATGEKTIVYCVNIDHAESMAKLFSESGIPAAAISSKNTKAERAEILRKFKSGEIRVLMNANLLIEGFDAPDVSAIINAAPTLSLVNAEQRGGRGLRLNLKDPGKVLFLIELVDQYSPDGVPPITFDQIIGGGVLLPKLSETSAGTNEGNVKPRLRQITVDAKTLNLIAEPEEVLRAGTEMARIREEKKLARIRKRENAESETRNWKAEEAKLQNEGWTVISDAARTVGTRAEQLKNKMSNFRAIYPEFADEALVITASSGREFIRKEFFDFVKFERGIVPESWMTKEKILLLYNVSKETLTNLIAKAISEMSPKQQSENITVSITSASRKFSPEFINSLGITRIPTRDPNGTCVSTKLLFRGWTDAMLNDARRFIDQQASDFPKSRYLDPSGNEFITKDLTRSLMNKVGESYGPLKNQEWVTYSKVINLFSNHIKDLEIDSQTTEAFIREVVKDNPQLAWRRKEQDGRYSFVAFHKELITLVNEMFVKKAIQSGKNRLSHKFTGRLF